MLNEFLPINAEDMKERGWDEVDFVYVIGDAYVDHPSFGHAIISRMLDAHGYKVGIISQPDWKDKNSVKVFGMPRLGFLVMSGNMDSMVNHYTVAKKRRNNDAYTPGGVIGKRPDYAAVVYCNLIRQAYKDAPIILGGVEASLRRFAHYDYWSDSLKRSVLLDSQANLILYGMGERSIIELAEALNSGLSIKDITFIAGSVFKAKNTENLADFIILPSFKEISESKKKFAESFAIQEANTDPFTAKTLIEKYPDGSIVVQNPPQKPLTTEEMDFSHDLSYTRRWHPSYDALGGVPALEEVKFSITSNRGCFGSCSFCAIAFHQGRIVQTRSHKSILDEAVKYTQDKDFKGYIHDVGGPTANFRQPACKKQLKSGACKNKKCLCPTPCKNMIADHSDYVELLRKLRSIPKVKKVFIRSGIRFDYLLADKNNTFLKELVEHHISGQLRVAPEHVSDNVLSLMGKPSNAVYTAFLKKFDKANAATGKKQYVVPYLMSSHPGSTLDDAIELALYIKRTGHHPEQVQDFYPTPFTASTCMYYTEIDPHTMKKVFVAKTPHDKAMQRALIQYNIPENYYLVREALIKAGRQDLIGFGKNCLIPPRKIEGYTNSKPVSSKSKTYGTQSKGKSAKKFIAGKPSRTGKTAKQSPVRSKPAKISQSKKTHRN
ncbi:MAG: YgiQ family radical SAM protein [Ruminococcaceae bacterium]|nr:YgiQ family radical SAM protein [Oscillospiraceae bacterium]